MSGLIVAGMHRSGTSLVARLLQEGGWHAGEEQLRSADEDYFEDAAFVALHRRWLAACLPPGEGHADWGLSDAGEPQPSLLVAAAADAAAFHAQREQQRDRWVAKDPRASLFLEQWATVESLRFVLVYRSSWDVTDSAVRLGHPPFCANPSLVRRAWVLHNQRIVAFAHRHRARCVVLAAEALAADPGGVWRRLADVIGLDGEVPRDLLDRTKLQTRDRHHPIVGLTQSLHPECAGLLDELDELADVPRPPGGRTRQRATLLPGGSLPAGTGLQVVIPCRDDGAFLDEAIASVMASCAGPTELTIVDDGSTDAETQRILGVLAATGHQVVAAGGVGLPAARNRGIATSHSLAVLPLDADNRVLPALAHGLAVIEAGEADVVHGSWQEFGLRSRRIDPPEASWESLLPANTIDACALVRRDLLDRLGGYVEALPFLEDWALWLAALAAGGRFHRLPELTFRYLVRPGSLVSSVWDDDARRGAALHRVIDPHAAHTGHQAGRIVHQLLTSMKRNETLVSRLEQVQAEATARVAAMSHEAAAVSHEAAALSQEVRVLRAAQDAASADSMALRHQLEVVAAQAATQTAAAESQLAAQQRELAVLRDEVEAVRHERDAVQVELAAVRARRGYRLVDIVARRTMPCRRPFSAVARRLATLRRAPSNDGSTRE
ncbi:MAG: glycosyltransferase [Ilumatobacteraceae bacterium]